MSSRSGVIALGNHVEGFLKLKSFGFLRRRRYFVLQEGELMCHRTFRAAFSPTNDKDMVRYRVRRVEYGPNPSRHELVIQFTDGSKIKCYATSQEEAEVWYESLLKQISLAQRTSPGNVHIIQLQP